MKTYLINQSFRAKVHKLYTYSSIKKIMDSIPKTVGVSYPSSITPAARQRIEAYKRQWLKE